MAFSILIKPDALRMHTLIFCSFRSWAIWRSNFFIWLCRPIIWSHEFCFNYQRVWALKQTSNYYYRFELYFKGVNICYMAFLIKLQNTILSIKFRNNCIFLFELVCTFRKFRPALSLPHGNVIQLIPALRNSQILHEDFPLMLRYYCYHQEGKSRLLASPCYWTPKQWKTSS